MQLAVSVLQDLLQYSSQLPELAREVGLNSVLGILTSLLSLKSEVKLLKKFCKVEMLPQNTLNTFVVCSPGACTMNVAQQTQGYRISLGLTKPNQCELALLVPLESSWSLIVDSCLDPEFKISACVHMNE